MANDKALATQTEQTLAPLPDYLKSDKNEKRGLEGTVQSDINIPRLALAQNNSPQVVEGDARKIEGMKPGDLFNSITGENYGRWVEVQMLRKMPLRAMQFRPIEEGGGVVDPNVPLNDERLRWGTTGDKKKDRPIATLFRDFICVVLASEKNAAPRREMIALSFKSSGIAAAKTLWGLVTMRNQDVFKGKYRIGVKGMTKPQPHFIYVPENANWVSAEDARLGQDSFEAVQLIETDKIDRDREPGDEEFEHVPAPTGAASEM